jgi:Mrp family chromosome partitioning ATPase
VRSRVVLMDCDLLNPSLHHIFGFLPLIDTRKTCRGSIQGLRIATPEFTRTTDTHATR